jgi:plasmid stability protein
MKQLLLRVPDDLHRRIAARAKREGRSMNALAGAILDASTGADTQTPQERLRARAAALGLLNESNIDPPQISGSERKGIIASTRGIGPLVDKVIDEDRGRLE